MSSRLTIGDVVLISDPSEGIGVVRHIDLVDYIIGIELTDPLGTSNGVYRGIEYFKCRPKYGIFVSITDIVRKVSPEELLHKIVVLNRALAHKHSTLSAKNQNIDKLRKEVITLKQALQTYTVNQHNMEQQIKALKYELQIQQQQNSTTPIKQLVDPPISPQAHPPPPGASSAFVNIIHETSPSLSNDLLKQIQNNKQRHSARNIAADVSDDEGYLRNDQRSQPQLPSQQPLNEEASIDLEDDLDQHLNAFAHAGHNNRNSTHLQIAQQTLNRESKPQTPDHNTDEDEQEALYNPYINARSRPVQAQHIEYDNMYHPAAHSSGESTSSRERGGSGSSSGSSPKKPRSRPPSRRGSFLQEYAHHPYGNDIINRELILNRGRKLNHALTSYMDTFHQKNEMKKRRKSKRSKHSRELSNQQLGFMAPSNLNMNMNMLSSGPRPLSPTFSHNSHTSHHSQVSQVSHHSVHSNHSKTSSHSSHSRPQHHHQKKPSNAEVAAQILRKEVEAKTKAIEQQYGYQRPAPLSQQYPHSYHPQSQAAAQNHLPSMPGPTSMSHNVSMVTNTTHDQESDEMSDDHFTNLSNRFNHSIGNHTEIPPMPPASKKVHKRGSRSEPNSPRNYHNLYDFGAAAYAAVDHSNSNNANHNVNNHNQAGADNLYFDDNSTPRNHPIIHSTRSSVGTFNYRLRNNLNSGSKDNKQSALNKNSIWRKNREAFLKQMDKKLEEAMTKFAAKDAVTGTANQAIQHRAIHTKFNRPLVRKRMHSYHQHSKTMQRVAQDNSMLLQMTRARTNADEETDANMLANRNIPARTTKPAIISTTTTFNKYSSNADVDIDSLFSKQPTFKMQARRSVSLPTSPKHHVPTLLKQESNLTDTLSLGDQHEEEEDEEDEEEDEMEKDVLDDNTIQPSQPSNTDHVIETVSDESSITDDLSVKRAHQQRMDDDQEEDKMPDEDNLYVARKESHSIQYDRSIRRRRLRFGRTTRHKMYANSSSSHDDEDMDDEDEDEEPDAAEMDGMRDMEIPDAHTMNVNINGNGHHNGNYTMSEPQHVEDEEHEHEHEPKHSVLHIQRTRIKARGGRTPRRRRYTYRDDSDSDEDQPNEIIETDEDEEEEEDEEHETQAQHNDNDEYIELDEDAYQYYQTKKRNSQVNMLERDEFEKEFEAIMK